LKSSARTCREAGPAYFCFEREIAMTKLARRRKTFELDGAQFVIAPLTYGQLEEYAAKSKEINEKFKDKKAEEYQQEDWLVYRSMRFWVICAALNNATPDGPLITEDDIKNEMENGILQPLWEEIIRFSGLEVPKVTMAAAGESQAGS
jgi:hypothetical protein